MSRQERDKAVALELSFSRSLHRALEAGVVAFLGILTMAMAVEASEMNSQSDVLPDASKCMPRNAEDVLRHFDELVAVARGEKGPVLLERMAEAIRNSQASEVKRQAVDRFLDHMECILDEGHASIPPSMAVQRIIGVTFFPGVSVRPSYGVERVEQILARVLVEECPDRKARFEAVQGLLLIAFVHPNRREEIIDVLQRLRTAEESAQNYPAQDVDHSDREHMLNRLDEVIKMIESFTQEEAGGSECITDGEYLALQQLPESELLERVRRGPFNDYALFLLMRNGCDDEELDYLFRLATERKGHAAMKILSAISVALLNPLEEGTGTEADRNRLTAYLEMLEEARASSKPEYGGGWIEVLTQELRRISGADADVGEHNGEAH